MHTRSMGAKVLRLAFVGGLLAASLPVWAQEPPAPAVADPLARLDREGAAHARAAIAISCGVQQGRGYGAGIVVEPGLILTSSAVVTQPGQEVVVWLADRRRVAAKVVAFEAAIKAVLLAYSPASSESGAVTWGDDPPLAPGQLVYTVGNPYGVAIQTQTPACSCGVVSGRYVPDGDAVPNDQPWGPRDRLYAGPVIETTAAVNNGNFGGPLVDRAGRLVGMVEPSFSFRRWLGVAIPAAPLKDFVLRHKAGKSKIEAVAPPPPPPVVEPVFLGIRVTAFRMGSRPRQGALAIKISAVAPGSPAERAGLLVDDILWSVGGDGLRSPASLDATLAKLKPGDKIEIVVIRGKDALAKRVAITLTLGSRPY